MSSQESNNKRTFSQLDSPIIDLTDDDDEVFTQTSQITVDLNADSTDDDSDDESEAPVQEPPRKKRFILEAPPQRKIPAHILRLPEEEREKELAFLYPPKSNPDNEESDNEDSDNEDSDDEYYRTKARFSN